MKLPLRQQRGGTLIEIMAESCKKPLDFNVIVFMRGLRHG